jgi:hypothetical protein
MVASKNLDYRITHKTGSCRSGIDLTGTITHVVINNNSLCGNNPNKKSSWSEYDDQIITCKKCIKILASITGGQ